LRSHIVERVDLAGGSIVCTPLSLDHAEAQLAAILESTDALSGTMPWFHPAFSIDEARSWASWCQQAWDEGTHYEFAITEIGGRYVGACGLGQVNPNLLHANLQYWIRTSATRKGVASTAARLVSQWGLDSLRLMRIEITMPTSNVASLRTAERAGARLEGVLRNQMRWEDRSHDAYVLSFIADDLRSSDDPRAG
jgi:RimJ/RimL family protein N-acetyltransferase